MNLDIRAILDGEAQDELEIRRIQNKMITGELSEYEGGELIENIRGRTQTRFMQIMDGRALESYKSFRNRL